MIPILYDKNETDFSRNGVGYLADAIQATVTEERNGAYEMTMQYPVTGLWYDRLTRGAVVKVKANETGEPQLFRVYQVSRPMNGIVTYHAEHISYLLSGVPTLGLLARSTTAQTAIDRALSEAAFETPFRAWSDISTLNSTAILTPCSVRALLGGQNGSILDVWGGEYEFDNFTVKLHQHRGADNGVTIEYGKNLTDLRQEENIAECYTHLMPYAVYTPVNEDGTDGEETVVSLPEKVLPIEGAENIGHNRAYIMDFTDRFEDGETFDADTLRAKAEAYLQTADLGAPKINITVSFVQLWQTEEYKNIAPLERVKLCDTVTVRFSRLGVDAKTKVIKTVYNALSERYESITLGDAKSSFADTLRQTTEDLADVKKAVSRGQSQVVERMKEAIRQATDRITGHEGGYVVLNPAEQPQEVLILDKPSIEEAERVWRWNSGGLGYSKNGYEGPYELAVTMDGAIVADFITAGELDGGIIKAGSIQTDALSVEYKNAVTEEITGQVAGLGREISQAFRAADEEVLSQIKESLTDYSTTTEMETYVSQTAEGIESSVTETVTGMLDGYPTTEEMQSYVRQTAGRIDWIVQSGTSASNFTMTPRAVQLATESLTLSVKTGFPGSVSVRSIAGTSYTFQKGSDGYYESTNKGDTANGTAAHCRVTCSGVTSEAKLILSCINYAESTYDYGYIGKVDQALTTSNIVDSDSLIERNFKGEQSPDPVEVTITIPAGTHYFDIKYIKDSTRSENNDSFKFKFEIEQNAADNETKIVLSREGIELSSANMTITGTVTFEDLAGAGRSVINGSNIQTGTISAERIDTSSLSVKKITYYDSDVVVFSSYSEERGTYTYSHISIGDQNGAINTVEILGQFITFGRRRNGGSEMEINTYQKSVVCPTGDPWKIGDIYQPFEGHFNDIYFERGSSTRYRLYVNESGRLCFSSGGIVSQLT